MFWVFFCGIGGVPLDCHDKFLAYILVRKNKGRFKIFCKSTRVLNQCVQYLMGKTKLLEITSHNTWLDYFSSYISKIQFRGVLWHQSIFLPREIKRNPETWATKTDILACRVTCVYSYNLRSHPHTPGRYPGPFTNSSEGISFFVGFGEVWVP